MAATHATGWAAAGDAVTHVLGTGSSRAAGLAAEIGAEIAGSLDELLAGVDVVDICSPTDTHLGYIRAAAASKTAIVCEKPLGRNYSEARQAVTV